MFQVASHPTSFDAFATGPMSPAFDMPMSPASALLSLPRTLARPRSSSVSRDAIIQASPELADVPLEYVRAGLIQQAPHMLAAIQAISSHLPSSVSRSSLPPSIALPASASAPTHILAVTSSSKSNPSTTAALYATHHLVLLSSCALLPNLPHARSGTAPVVPVALPHAESFPALHAFLYTRSQLALLSSLLCLNIPASAAGPSDTSKRAGQLAGALVQASGGDMARLMSIVKRVNGMWRNACALGVNDLELWDTMDLAWEAVLGAINAVARR
jgi:hypothetical protein